MASIWPIKKKKNRNSIQEDFFEKSDSRLEENVC